MSQFEILYQISHGKRNKIKASVFFFYIVKCLQPIWSDLELNVALLLIFTFLYLEGFRVC